MRSVFMSHSAAASGAELSLLTELSTWRSPGSQALLLVAEEGPVVRRAQELGLDVIVRPWSRRARAQRREDRNLWHRLTGLLSLVRSSLPVRRVLRAHDADVVVAISIKSVISALIAGRVTGTRVVWSLHDRIATDSLPRAAVVPLRHVLPRLVDGIVVNSRETLATIRPGTTPVLESPPALALTDRPFAPPQDPLRSVVVVGRLAPWKGQDLFLRAFAEVFAGSGVRGTVVGGALFGEDDYARSLVDLTRTLGIEGQITFTGHVDDVWPHLADADVLVHCSRVPEPFGQVVVEGMWARCAVIASAPGGPTEIVRDRVDGLLTPAGDVDALVAALTELRNYAGLRERLADEAHASAARYDVRRTPSRLRSWLEELVRDQAPAR